MFYWLDVIGLIIEIQSEGQAKGLGLLGKPVFGKIYYPKRFYLLLILGQYLRESSEESKKWWECCWMSRKLSNETSDFEI